MKYLNVLAGILAILSAIGGQWLLLRGQTTAAVGLYAVGILLALWAFRPYRDIAQPYTPQPGTLQRLNPLWLLPILLLPGGVAALALDRLQPESPSNLFWLIHIASILLFLACVYFVENRTRPPDADEPPPPPWKTSERLALFGILFIGLFLRLYQLPDYPFGTWFDEASIGLEAQRILRESQYRPLFIAAINAPGHYVYLVSALFALLPPVTYVIRLASVLLGLLTIPAGFLAGRHLFGRGPGLIVAFLVAVSRWDVNFSRIGMFNISLPLFAFLAIAFLLRGLRRNRLTDYAWAGVFLGFGLDFYVAFQIFFVVVALFSLHHIATHLCAFPYQWKGFVVAAAAAVLFLAPLAAYALDQPDVYFGRTRTLSIFNEYPPEQAWEAVRESATKHLLMYNLRGDPNGRHNLPGAPMLASVAGALLVLGLALSLSRFWKARSLLLIVWFLGMMTGGVFAVSFEAPQSLRAIGTLPVVYLLGTVPLALLWQNWRATPVGGRFPRLYVWPLLVLLAFVAVPNYQLYFERQKNDFAVWNAFSTGETIAGQRIAAEKDSADIHLTALYANHPSVRYVSRSEPFWQRVDTTASLPLRAASERDVLILLDSERRSYFEEAQRYYPNAQFVEHKPPFGGPTSLYEIRLSPEDIASIQGLNVAYFAGAEWSGPPVATAQQQAVAEQWPQDAPLPAPFSAEWSGILSVDRYGPHKLTVRAPGPAELWVDEELVASGDGGEIFAALELAIGNHSLRIRAAQPGSAEQTGPVEFLWQRPGEAEQLVPSWALNVPPVTNNGLLGRYYSNGDWREPVAFAQIDPQISLYFHNIPLPRPYTVEWEGKIAIPQAGIYALGIESIDESELFIDGERVAASPEPNQYDEGLVNLDAGLHDIRIRFADRTDHTHVNLFWTPPGRGRQIVPAEALFPPQGSYAHVEVADLSVFDEAPPAAFVIEAESVAADEVRSVRFETVSDDFERPRGIAAANGRLYVADPEARALLVLEASGRRVARVRQSDRRFSEPVDVAADAAGNVYVLDAAGGGQVSVHDADGDFVRVVPIPGGMADRARGLGVDAQDRIWLAVTPALVVAAFDTNGQELIRFSTAQGGADLQPVDVAFHAPDAVYVSTVGVTALMRFSQDGEILDSWPLVGANSVDGPHLALAPDGVVYASQPEQGGLLRLAPAAGPDGEADVQAWILPPAEPVRKTVGIALDPSGELLLTDSENGRVYRVPTAQAE